MTGGRGAAAQVPRWAPRRLMALVAVVLLAGSSVPASSAQSIAERVSDLRDGRVRMSFAARPGVCAVGRNITTHRRSDDWESDCAAGPVHVSMRWRAGRLVDVDTYVGGRWLPASGETRDLGLVPAAEAARYLLSLARSGATRSGRGVIFPATLADSVEVWPDLLDIARDHAIPQATRKNAVFWLAHAAGDAALGDLTGLVDDQDEELEIREQAVFALSQLRGDRGVTALLEIARSHADRRIRRRALFWLGQSADPRAIALFEEILLDR